MNLLDRDQIQHEELLMLQAFKSFCIENDLRFSLAGGTLLGAVRHKGFIPWDDDIDVCMPRPDFDRFVGKFPAFANKTGYEIAWYANDHASQLFLKVVNPSICAYDVANKPTDNDYLWIDVFPYDGLPSSDKAIETIFRKAARMRNCVWIAQTKWTFGDSVLKKMGKCLIGPFVKLSKLDKICAKKLGSLAQEHPYETSDTVGCITWGLYGSGEAFPKSGFERLVGVDFCGEEYPAFSCWHEYLSGIYGDYMTPPPPKKRKAHGLKAWPNPKQ